MRIISRLFNRLCSSLLFGSLLLFLLLFSGSLAAQLLHTADRWLLIETENFTIYSQIGSRQSERIARDMEVWRQIAAFQFGRQSPLPRAAVKNLVYIFEDAQSLGAYTSNTNEAFFASTPRGNYMAVIAGDNNSTLVVRHYYSHFLIRNFLDLSVPRWYEEGMAGYLARMDIEGTSAEFERFTRIQNEQVLPLSETFSMERLLYRDEALASPRVIQIANIKSQTLLHYMLHGYEEEQFPDRRQNLLDYLGYLSIGRNERFAFDQSFDITPAQLDEELHNYFRLSERPPGEIETGEIRPVTVEADRMEELEISLALAELALNAGRYDNSQLLFQSVIDGAPEKARAYSGVADAMRFQENEDIDNLDHQVAELFETALAVAPTQLSLLLDYGEYWASELEDCGNVWPAAQRSQIQQDIETRLEQAFELQPENPEVNLALAQLYLLDGQDWSKGLNYQAKAFELLPAEGFIMEQEVKYRIANEDYAAAESLIKELSQPIHFWGEPNYVTDLRERLMRKRRGEPYDACANG